MSSLFLHSVPSILKMGKNILKNAHTTNGLQLTTLCCIEIQIDLLPSDEFFFVVHPQWFSPQGSNPVQSTLEFQPLQIIPSLKNKYTERNGNRFDSVHKKCWHQISYAWIFFLCIAALYARVQILEELPLEDVHSVWVPWKYHYDLSTVLARVSRPCKPSSCSIFPFAVATFYRGGLHERVRYAKSWNTLIMYLHIRSIAQHRNSSFAVFWQLISKNTTVLTTCM